MRMRTVRNYDFPGVASALQKAIRRGDARLAGYWAVELFESGYHFYLWRRLFTISAEDCAGIITKEIAALYQGFQLVNHRRSPEEPPKGRIFIAKAVILLCLALKSRDADHLTNLVYDRLGIPEKTLLADLEAARDSVEPIPDYALDVHTQRGRARGKTRRDFFLEEDAALNPKQKGLFDADIEKLKGEKK